MTLLSECFKVRSFILAATFCGLAFGTSASAQVRHSYLIDLNSKTVADLGTLGGDWIEAGGINNLGQVVGLSETAAGELHAFITGPNGGGMTDLNSLVELPPRIVLTSAIGINDAGQVIGSSFPDAFITDPNAVGVRKLGTFGGDITQAFDINDTGQVVGYSKTAGGDLHAFITGPDGAGMTDLGTLGAGSSSASSINDAGQVAGESYTVGGFHAFITGSNGMGMRDLGTLGGDDSWTTGINDAGQVVGYSFTAGGPYHAFITGPDGEGMRDLGTLGGDYSQASDINDSGQVVGWAQGNGYAHAFVTGPDGEGMTDLNSLVDLPQGVILTHALGINNNGQVIALTEISVPIPEPEAYALMLAGLGLVGFMARPKKAEA